MEESIVVYFTISTQESSAFNLSSLLRRERMPDRLLADRSGRTGGRSCGNSAFREPETTDTSLEVCHKTRNPAFKGPETLDTTLDSLHKK